MLCLPRNDKFGRRSRTYLNDWIPAFAGMTQYGVFVAPFRILRVTLFFSPEFKSEKINHCFQEGLNPHRELPRRYGDIELKEVAGDIQFLPKKLC
jgi:hypothetical protein